MNAWAGLWIMFGLFAVSFSISDLAMAIRNKK